MPDGLPAAAEAAATTSVDGALVIASELPAGIGEALTVAAQQAFSSGLNTAAIVSAAIAALTALIAATRLRHVQPTGKADQDI